MKIKLTTRKPRNPLVAASLQRLAGPHGRGSGHAKARRAGRDEIRRELQGFSRSPGPSASQRAARREHDPHSP